jgi:hypothetical protein
MKLINKSIVVIILLIYFGQAISAQQNGFGPHGGRLKKVGKYKIELFGCDNYLEIYLYNADTNAINNNGIVGNIEFYYDGSATLISPITHYGMDGFTAKIPVKTFTYCKPALDINGEIIVTEKFENECLKRN